LRAERPASWTRDGSSTADFKAARIICSSAQASLNSRMAKAGHLALTGLREMTLGITIDPSVVPLKLRHLSVEVSLFTTERTKDLARRATTNEGQNRNLYSPLSVIPAEAGIHGCLGLTN
jgi:hypothetical protein